MDTTKDEKEVGQKSEQGELCVQDVNSHDKPTKSQAWSNEKHPGDRSVSVSVISGSDDNKVRNEEDDLEKKTEKLRSREPLLFCKFIVNYPKTSFALFLGIHITFALVTGALIRFGYDIIPFSLNQLPLSLKNDVDHKRAGAWNLRFLEENDIYDRLKGSSNSTKIDRERSIPAQVIELFFEIKDGNVFTKSALEAIRIVEDELTNTSNYTANFCYLDFTGNCTKPISILRYFDGTYASLDPLLSDSSFSNIHQTLGAAIENNKTKSGLRYHLGKDYVINTTTDVASSSITRSRMFLAFPLAGYNGTDDRKSEQLDKIQMYLNTTFYKKLNELEKKDEGGVDFFYNNGHLLGVSITAVAMMDLMLVVAGLGFIFVFMWIQTQSLWITGWSILSIFTGFLAANMVYRIVFDFSYFGTFHILAIFIILGIGADDVFVFVDTFKSTGHHDYSSLAHRLSDCYRKASVAMLFTSLTTATAFFISAASPLAAVSTFGLFAGLLVVVNYMTVLTFIPTVVITWHNTWNKCRWCPCLSDVNDTVHPVGSSPALDADAHHRKNPVVRFFRGPYYRFVSHKIARWAIVAFFVMTGGVFIYFASQLQPNEDQIEFLKPDTNFGKALNRRTSAFSSNEEEINTQVLIAWGLKNHDYSACHKTNFTCTGKTVWDDTFDLNSAEAQKALNDFCTTLKNLSPKEENDLKVQRNFVTKEPEVGCFIHDLENYFQIEQDAKTIFGTRKYATGTNFSLPHVQANMVTLMQGNPLIFNASTLPADFKRYFETGLSYWMYDGMNPKSDREAMRKYGYLVGEQVETGQSQKYKIGDFMFGNRLRFAAIIVNTTVKGRTLGYPKGIPLRNNWEDYVSKKVSAMPKPLQGGFQLTTFIWEWVKVQETLSTSALLGIAIGVSVAYPILLMATNNLITGSLALLMLAMITVSVVGFLPMNGWKLGVLESLNMVLVVGLSVDYVMHLAEGYSRSPHDNRHGRTQDMLEEVGISVLSGAITTAGASMCMLIAQILFFTQFGLVMFITIMFSILHALVLFPTLLALIGPQGDTGCITAIFKNCCSKSPN